MDDSAGAAPLAARLFEQHGRSVYRYCRRLTRDRATAEDLFQEVFLRIVRHGHTYEARERERAWVFRIARNVLIDHDRVARRAHRDPAGAEPIAAPGQPVQLGLRLALAALKADDREAFLLAEIGGLTYGEIATATGTTVAAVRSRIYRARLALRSLLDPPAPRGADHAPKEDDD